MELMQSLLFGNTTHMLEMPRYTDMASDGTVNVGQLVREKFGQNNVYIVGFGSTKDR
jgi:hypothetical protein